MVVPCTTLRYEPRYSPFACEREALDVVQHYSRIREYVAVKDDEVLANASLLEAYLYLGYTEIQVVDMNLFTIEE